MSNRSFLAPAPEIALLWRLQPLVYRGYLIFGVLAAAVSAVLALSGPVRLSSPAYATVRAVGGPAAWAIMWAAAALAFVVVPRYGAGALRGLMLAVATLHALLAVEFGNAAATLPDVSWMGSCLFSVLTLLHVSAAETYRPRRVTGS